MKSRDRKDDIHASLCRCNCNMRRETFQSTPGRNCIILSARRYPLGTHLGLRHLKPYNQACSPCGNTNASRRKVTLRTTRCRLKCFLTTLLCIVEHGERPHCTARPGTTPHYLVKLGLASSHRAIFRSITPQQAPVGSCF